MAGFKDKDKKKKGRRIIEEIVEEDDLYGDEEIIDEEEYYEDEEILDEEEYYADEEEYYGDDEEIVDEEEYYAEDDDEIYAEDDYGEGYGSGEYYEEEDDEEYDEDEEMPLGGIGAIFAKFHGLPVLDKIVALTGVIVLVCALVVGTVYAGIRGMQKQVDSFDELGYQVEDIDLIGGSGIAAVTAAQIQRLALLNNEEIESEEEEEEVVGTVIVEMHLSSILKDLKIKFVNSHSGKLVANVPFQVEVTDGSGSTSTWTDEDKDGIIYTQNISGGTYSVKMVPLEGYADISLASLSASTIDVKSQIEYKKVDVSDEIKSEKEVNASKEDAQKEVIEEKPEEVESKLTDTVEFVASSSSAGSTTYKEIDKSTITDPSTLTSMLSRMYFQAATTKELTLSSSSLSMTAGDTANLTATFKVTTEDSSGSGESGGGDSGGGESGGGESGGGSGEGGESGGGSSESGDNNGDDNSSGNTGNSVSGISYHTATTTETNVTNSASWTTSNSSVATVSGGRVTAVGAGTANITASYEGKTATCAVTVTAASPAYTITAGSSESTTVAMTVGGTTTLHPTVTATNGGLTTISWTSTDTTVATVSSAGLVTAKKAGTTSVKATCADGTTSLTYSVTVTAAAPTYTIALGSGESASVALAVNGTTTLHPTVTTTNGGSTTVSWTSSDTTVATVSSAGLVTGKKAGTATIKATCADNVTYLSYTVTVTATTYTVAYGTNESGNVSVVAGNSITLAPVVTVTNNASTTLTWVSSDTSIATVSDKGIVTGVKVGKCTVTGTCADRATSIAYNITVTTGTVTLSATSMTINAGKTATFTVTLNPTTDNTFTVTSSDTAVATVAADKNTTGATITVTAVKKGTATITVTDAKKQSATCAITVKATAESDTTTMLTDKSGNQVYVLDNGNYRKAAYADYFTATKFYVATTETVYTGWQTLNGNTYYFKADHTYVTGEQVIQGAKYNFASDGTLITGSGTLGIDVSKWNGSINWSAVKNSGVSYVIIRCGYRGTSTGALIEDPKFKSNISGAISAGLKVGVYFFSQAVNQVEAVEEASMVLTLINGYKISYPVFLDVETGSRANGIDSATRTTVIDTFCKTIQASGYTAGVYANKTWLSEKMNAGALSNYKIWLAQYASAPTYTGRYNMWQYTKSGTVSGISGKVDMNLSYLGY